jgi:SNF2 family DNA or RNA helicase
MKTWLQPKNPFLLLNGVRTNALLNKLFEGARTLHTAVESNMNIPSTLLTPLLPHQQHGVAWMIQREEGNSPIPFWRRQPNGFFNEISNTLRPALPDPVKGGLLADCMGLGKSLQMLTLCALRPKGCTLLICPASVIGSWQLQLEEHFQPGTWKYCVHHGTNRTTAQLLDYDLVFTTFDVVVRDVNLLRKLPFTRIVLDEAHLIRNRHTLRFKALLKLQATHRWCLTGTPLVNSQDDAFAYFSFLRLVPLQDWPVWNSTISKPITEKRGDAKALAMLQLAIKSLSLRRDKSILSGLPIKTIQVRHLDLHEEQAKVYNTIFDSMQKVMKRITTKDLLTNMSSVLEVLLRLRQACMDPRLITKSRIQACQQLREGGGE